MSENKQSIKIAEHLINNVVIEYANKILKSFSHIDNVDLILDVDEKEPKHRQREKYYDDITLLIYVKNDNNINNIKELFVSHLNNLLKHKCNIENNSIVSSLYPIYGSYKSDTKLVKINNIIVNNKNEYEFRKNYLSLSKERQSLYTNIIDKCTDMLGETKSMFKYKLMPDSISYYVIKSNGDKQCIWTSNDWNKVLDILDETFGEDYDPDDMSLDDIVHHMRKMQFEVKVKL